MNTELYFNELNVELRKLAHFASCYENVIDVALNNEEHSNKENLEKAKESISGLTQGLLMVHSVLVGENELTDHHETFKDLIQHAFKKLDLDDVDIAKHFASIDETFKKVENDKRIELGLFNYE